MKTLAMDELIDSLKVHEQKLMYEIQLHKGKITTLKASQKTKTKHQSKELNTIVAFKAQNNDDELSEEDEEELAFLTKSMKTSKKKNLKEISRLVKD